MVSKVSERIYAESAARLLSVDWQIHDVSEPPDFEVHASGTVFGLEVRQVFADREGDFGSQSKHAESLKQRAISKVADAYYARGGAPVSARFLGSVCSVAPEQVAAEMLLHPVSYPNGRDAFCVGALKIFITAAPTNYRRWICVDDRVGWSREVTSSELQAAVDSKQPKLALYRQRFAKVVLLLVADATFNSGRLAINKSLSVANPGFTAIYFLSHPEAVAQVA